MNPIARCLTAFVCLALPLSAAEPPKAASAPCECTAKPVLPVALSAMETNQGWSLYFKLPPCAVVTDILVRFDDRPEVSTGHAAALDVMTGKPEASRSFLLPPAWATPGEHTLTVRMMRPDGTADGPHKLQFNPGDASLAASKSDIEQMGGAMIEFAEHVEGATFLMLTSLFMMEDDLKEIRWSIDSCDLDKRVVLGAPAVEGMPTRDRPYVEAPKDSTRFACAQVVFRDGTVSQVMRVER